MTHASRRPLIVGNWKMHRSVSESVALAREVAAARSGPRTDVVIAPVFTALYAVHEALRGTRVLLAAQDVHWQPSGACTGEVSAPQLRDVGCVYVLIGHSERRQLFGETDAMVRQKLNALHAEGIVPIACLGETLSERDSGATLSVLERQLRAIVQGLEEGVLSTLVIAYEPVWAIGTGKTASAADAQKVHAFLRTHIENTHGELAERVRILYGGSVKPDNAAELLAQPDIDGLLVGGASLDAASFARIIHAAG